VGEKRRESGVFDDEIERSRIGTQDEGRIVTLGTRELDNDADLLLETFIEALVSDEQKW